jgi:hypothetical protein
MTRTAAITFDRMTTFDGVSECFMLVDGEPVGSLSRERPTRLHAGTQRGIVRDTSGAWLWSAEIDGDAVEVPDGATLRVAKRLMRDAFVARNA